MSGGERTRPDAAGVGAGRTRPRPPNILRSPARSPWETLLRRLALAIVLIMIVTFVNWLTRDGLRDNSHPDRRLNLATVFYFTIVSMTTLGYGDVVPVSDGARTLNAVLLTPARIFILLLFVGTAYELTELRTRYREEYRMQQLRERLRDHTIICGFGVKGRAIAGELLAHGGRPEEIVVIDPTEEASAEAAAQGFISLRGDAATEAILHAAVVEHAAYVLAAPNRDDACALICLTVRSLAPGVWLVASAREEENIKLLYRSGADLVVSPSLSGGRLMGAAVRQRAVPLFLEDLLSFGRGVDAAEHAVTAGEVGQPARTLPALADAPILGVQRGDRRFTFNEIADLPLEQGDLVVYLKAEAQ